VLTASPRLSQVFVTNGGPPSLRDGFAVIGIGIGIGYKSGLLIVEGSTNADRYIQNVD
jgi:hypothetical protein